MALVVAAIACGNDGDGGGGATFGPIFNQPPAFDNTVLSIVPRGDGSGDLYVGGAFTTYNGTNVARLVRLNANGSVDPAFVTGAGFNSPVFSIALAGDGTGDLYVGGGFTNYNGTAASGLVRLTARGTVDPTFVTGTGFNSTVFSVALAGDGTGDLYVGGAFTNYNGTAANDLIRLNARGTVDPTFVTGAGFNGSVRIIALAGDGTGNLYVGGEFTSYQSLTIGRLVRLNSHGTAI